MDQQPCPIDNLLSRVDVKEGGRLVASYEIDPGLINVSSLKALIEADIGILPARQRLVVRGTFKKYIFKEDGSMSVFLTTSETTKDSFSSSSSILLPSNPSPNPRMESMAPIANMMAKNPELLEKMFMANPQVQALMKKNPQLRHALSDPKTLQDMLQMSTNRSYYQEAMRGHDRALSNLENIPQGFQHLVQMQRTLSAGNDGSPSSMGVDRPSSKIKGSEPTRQLVKEPFPNPWAKSIRRKAVFAPPDEDDDNSDDDDDENYSLDEGKDEELATKFSKQLKIMHDLGFDDKKENIRALLRADGNVSEAIDWIMSRKYLFK